MLYNMLSYVMFLLCYNMLCYVMFILPYINRYVMLHNMLSYVTLYNLFLLGYITCYFMLYNMLFYVYVILYLTIIPGGHVGYEMIDSQRGA